jgi:hypothetical protein
MQKRNSEEKIPQETSAFAFLTQRHFGNLATRLRKKKKIIIIYCHNLTVPSRSSGNLTFELVRFCEDLFSAPHVIFL